MAKAQETELRLILPDYWPKNVNRTQGHHWATVKKEKDTAYSYMLAAYLNTSPRVYFEGPVTVTVTREWGQRERAMDEDNLYSAAKFLVDALREGNLAEQARRLEVITDDNPDNIELHVQQRAGEKPKGEPRRKRTLISIEGMAKDICD